MMKPSVPDLPILIAATESADAGFTLMTNKEDHVTNNLTM
jgi:hypothetical protein